MYEVMHESLLQLLLQIYVLIEHPELASSALPICSAILSFIAFHNSLSEHWLHKFCEPSILQILRAAFIGMIDIVPRILVFLRLMCNGPMEYLWPLLLLYCAPQFLFLPLLCWKKSTVTMKDLLQFDRTLLFMPMFWETIKERAMKSEDSSVIIARYKSSRIKNKLIGTGFISMYVPILILRPDSGCSFEITIL